MSRDVLLLLDHRDAWLDPLSLSLVARARELAESRGGRASALLLCAGEDGLEKPLERSGLHAIHRVVDARLAPYSPEAWSRATAAAVEKLEPALLLCAHTSRGREIAPWVAARLALPLLSNCLTLRAEGGDLVAERLVHSGAWQVELRLAWQGGVVASLARGAAAGDIGAVRPPALEPLDVDRALLEVETVVREESAPAAGEVDITRADVVVAGGRGVGSASELALLEALARELGGVVAGSRPLVDLGWLPPERLVGASGSAIRPRVYLACGISGASQHVAGIAGAKVILAINADPAAPIFHVSDVGVVADLREILPALLAEARRA